MQIISKHIINKGNRDINAKFNACKLLVSHIKVVESQELNTGGGTKWYRIKFMNEVQ